MTRFVSCSIALALLGACAETAPACSMPGYVWNGAECLPDPSLDASTRDAADAFVPADAGPCDPACIGGEVCAEIDEGVFDCVQCGSDTDCGDRFCVSNTCVDCRGHDDCTDPEVAQCSPTGSCVPCSNSGQCAGTGGSICDTSLATPTCVECNLGNSTACTAGETCDLLAGRCVTLTNRQNCETCSNDLQCASGLRCIRMEYPTGTPRDTGHCLAIASPSCPEQHFAQPIDRSSINGIPGTYCGVNEALTTCEAVLALETNEECTSDAECPESGLCRTVGVLPGMRCTYRCSSATQCFATTVDANKDSCADGTVGDGMDYCGG